jgi:FixJ family two-component response regulator
VNGIELQDQLIAQGHRLPIIFVTAHPEMKARARTLAASAICLLGKPFSDEEFITCLDKAPAARGV